MFSVIPLQSAVAKVGPDNLAYGPLMGSDGNDWFLFNKDGDGGVKDKVTDMSSFETQYFADIDWLTNGS